MLDTQKTKKPAGTILLRSLMKIIKNKKGTTMHFFFLHTKIEIYEMVKNQGELI